MSRTLCAFALTSAIAVGAPIVHASVTPPANYIYSPLQLGTTTQSCVASGPGGTFVGVGRGFTANDSAVVLVKESGETRLVVFGFSSIADCAYDAAADVLYISDNADNADLGITTSFGNTAAQTGDTVFKVPNASHANALAAKGLELLPANSIEFAANLAVDSAGNLFVGNAAGTGAGTVLKIIPGPSSSVFLSGFDYTAGLALGPVSGHLFVAESLNSGKSQVHEFTAAGATVASPLVGPSFAFGSSDAAFDADGRLLVTGLYGGDVVAIDPNGPATSPFISGLTYAGSITVNPFTGRVEVLSSTFTGAAEDKTIHRFVPVTHLVAGRDAGVRECLHEFYGIELVAEAPGDVPKKAICVDGAACDADGEVNDRCVFPVGSCFNVSDPRLPECTPSAAITSVKASSGRDLRALDGYRTSVAAALPMAGPTCIFSDGVVVPVTIKHSGEKKNGLGRVTVSVEDADGKMDTDTATLVCQPAP